MTIQDQVVIIALEKLFAPSGHFNICTFDDLQKLLGLTVPTKTYLMLRCLHCVDYRNMQPGMREEIAEIVIGLIRQARPELDIEGRLQRESRPESTSGRAGSSFLRRLLPGAS